MQSSLKRWEGRTIFDYISDPLVSLAEGRGEPKPAGSGACLTGAFAERSRKGRSATGGVLRNEARGLSFVISPIWLHVPISDHLPGDDRQAGAQTDLIEPAPSTPNGWNRGQRETAGIALGSGRVERLWISLEHRQLAYRACRHLVAESRPVVAGRTAQGRDQVRRGARRAGAPPAPARFRTNG
jgi:hypothetical protein